MIIPLKGFRNKLGFTLCFGVAIGILLSYIIYVDNCSFNAQVYIGKDSYVISALQNTSAKSSSLGAYTKSVNSISTIATGNLTSKKPFTTRIKPPQAHSFKEAMAILHKERVATLKRSCRHSGLYLNATMPNQRSIYFEEYKASICDIQKCGTTSWLNAILTIKGYYTEEDFLHFRIVGQKALDQLDALRFSARAETRATMNIWKNTTKIIMVRNPFARLVSAYDAKLAGSTYGFSQYYANMSYELNRKYRSKRYKGADRQRNDTTASFEDFVNHLLDIDKKYYDSHWALYESVCQPCLFDVEIVAKLETIGTDVDYMRQRLNISEKHAGVFFPGAYGHTDAEKVQRMFASIPKENAKRLYKIYRVDFDRFGYSKPDWLT